MDKIFIYARKPEGGSFVVSYAITKDNNEVLASHLSTNLEWAKHDMGVNSDWKHDVYMEKFPNGYELIWLGMLNTPDEFISVAGEYGINVSNMAQ